MRSLFWKIFLWFWGAMILIALALYLVVLTTRPDPLPQPWRDTASVALTAYASAAAQEWERDGAEALRNYLQKAERRSDARFWFFDAEGHELTGRRLLRNFPPDPEAQAVPPNEPPPVPLLDSRVTPPANREGAPPDAPVELPPGARPMAPYPPRLDGARRHALETDEGVFEMLGPRVLGAQGIQSRLGRRYVLAGLMPRPNFGRPAADIRTQWIGGLVMLALSGLVCYGLVRYLTTPMVTLRAATRRLAAGDLAARTYAAQQTRRDEVTDLGRDFDAMAERIETLVHSQRQLLGDISHELRSPLSRLSMALALARRHAGQGAAETDLTVALERIGRETTRLNTLIGQLLELTRLESGEGASEVEPVDLEQLLREVVADADFEARSSERAVSLKHSFPCQIIGTHSLLHSAIENVVRNAVRYTPSDTEVEVSLDCDNVSSNGDHPYNDPTRHMSYAMIRVRDYGSGVPEDALSELFRPFYRVSNARDRESGGVGLGLAITERAIRSHGGTVTATNAPGGGLQIELHLPVDSPLQ